MRWHITLARFEPETAPSVIKIAIGRSWCLHLEPIYQGDRTSVEKNGLVTVADAPWVNEGTFIVVVEQECSRFGLLFTPEACES